MSKSESREKRVFIGFRATESEAAEIDTAAERAGLTRSAYVRAQSLATPKMRASRRPHAATEALATLFAQVRKCGGNLNQIAHQLNAGEAPERADIRAALVELRAVAARIIEAI